MTDKDKKEFMQRLIKPKLPNYIKTLDYEKIIKNYLKEDGKTHQIFSEKQFAINDDNSIYYYQDARALFDLSDVEYYANLTYDFEPEKGFFSISKISVFRNGKWIDKLQDAKFEILKREENFEKLQYDGKYTLAIILNDIRVGDIIVFDTLRVYKKDVFQNYFSYFSYQNSRFDIYYFRSRVLLDSSYVAQTEIRYFNDAYSLQEGSVEGYFLYEYEQKHQEGISIDENAPSWYDPHKYVLFSNTKSWKMVNDWALEIYNDEIYDAQDTIFQIAQEAREYSNDKKHQVMYVILYVQEQIRYFADSSGLGGVVPIDPNKSIAQRYADCKNKVVILKSILNLLDIESYPVLVNTYYGKRLKEMGPCVDIFNHMIIQIIIKKKIYWVDTTFTNQGSNIDTIVQASYYYGLVIKKETMSLSLIKPYTKTKKFSEHTFDLREKEATLYIATYHRGIKAELVRARLLGNRQKYLQDDYLKFYKKTYPDIKAKKQLSVIDNKEKNEVLIEEHYSLGTIWKYDEKDDEYFVTFYNDDVRDAHTVAPSSFRESPYSLQYPEDIVERRTVYLPQTYTWDTEVTTLEIDNEFFSFKKDEYFCENNIFAQKHEDLFDKKPSKDNLAFTGHYLRQKYKFKSKKQYVEIDEIAKYKKNIDDIYTSYTIFCDDPYDEAGLYVDKEIPLEEQPYFIEQSEIYDLREKEHTLKIVTLYRKNEAYFKRRYFFARDIEEIKKNYEEFYAKDYKEIKIQDVSVVMDNEDGFMIEETYLLGDAIVEYDEQEGLMFINEALYGIDIEPVDLENRYEIKYPAKIQISRSILFDKTPKLTGGLTEADNNFFHFSQVSRYNKQDNIYAQTITYQAKQRYITEEELAMYKLHKDEIIYKWFLPIKYKKKFFFL